MNDSEQYHTGRAAAYYTMTGVIRALLQPAHGQVARRDIEALMVKAEKWQVEAEQSADERRPMSDEVLQDQPEEDRAEHVSG